MRILRNILAVFAGWLVGSMVNGGLLAVGHFVYPIEGVDMNDSAALAEAMPNLGNEYLLFPFLAHALGTLVGAFIAVLVAQNHKMKFAWSIGGLFLVGGIIINIMITGPIWFTVVDILVAYLPMAFLGGKLGLKITPEPVQ